MRAAASLQLLLGCLMAATAIPQLVDEVDGVFPQLGTGAPELQDSKVVGHLKTAFERADKSAHSSPARRCRQAALTDWLTAMHGRWRRRAAILRGSGGVPADPRGGRPGVDRPARAEVQHDVRRQVCRRRLRDLLRQGGVGTPHVQPGDRLESAAAAPQDPPREAGGLLRYGDLRRMNLKPRLTGAKSFKQTLHKTYKESDFRVNIVPGKEPAFISDLLHHGGASHSEMMSHFPCVDIVFGHVLHFRGLIWTPPGCLG